MTLTYHMITRLVTIPHYAIHVNMLYNFHIHHSSLYQLYWSDHWSNTCPHESHWGKRKHKFSNHKSWSTIAFNKSDNYNWLFDWYLSQVVNTSGTRILVTRYQRSENLSRYIPCDFEDIHTPGFWYEREVQENCIWSVVVTRLMWPVGWAPCGYRLGAADLI